MNTPDDSRPSSENISAGDGVVFAPSQTLVENRSLDIAGRVAQDTAAPPINLNEKLPPGGDDTVVLVVDWDGLDDPQNPKNWSLKQKWIATVIVSGFTFISPVSSSIVAPVTNQIAAQFGTHNSVVIALLTSIFVFAFAIGPLFLGPLSEIYGRAQVLLLSNLWFLVWNLACGFAQNESQLLWFRFLSGLGCSAPVAIGGGVLGDCWRAEERGQAMSAYSLTTLVGYFGGPITGSWIAQRSTWRWAFWSMSIVGVAVQVVGLFGLQETYAPLLLERKAEKIRRSVDMEKATYGQVRTIYDVQHNRSWQAIMTEALVRPFALFVKEPIIQLLGVYMAYLYGMIFLFLTTIPSVFEGVYKQPVGIAGLHYIALGVGFMGTSELNTRMLDKIYVYLKDKNEGIGKPEFRLRTATMFIGTLLLPIGLLIAGWSVQAQTHWIAPDIGIVFIGAAIVLNIQCIQTYIVDAFTLYAASAMAAATFLRSLAGCIFPLFAPAMYSALGFGNGNTVLAVVAIVIGCPAPWVFWCYGERIRNASRYAR